jgi:hypothetical protein
MTVSTFHPREVDRFLFCCGGYRRWELIEDEEQWWWRLASDWGLAHIADVLMPVQASIRLQIDVSRDEPGACPGHGTLELCSRIREGRLGIDGLPFESETRLGVTLERGRIRLGGPDLVEPGVWPLQERQWKDGPITLRLDRMAKQVRLFIDDEQVAEAPLVSAAPALIMVRANSAGMPEAGTRFGTLEVSRIQHFSSSDV